MTSRFGVWLVTIFLVFVDARTTSGCGGEAFVSCVNGTVFSRGEKPVPKLLNYTKSFDKNYFDEVCRDFRHVERCVQSLNTTCNESTRDNLYALYRPYVPYEFICEDVKEILDELYPTVNTAPTVNWTSKYIWDLKANTTPDDLTVTTLIVMAIVVGVAIIVGVTMILCKRKKQGKRIVPFSCTKRT